jgi:transcriptional regulator with XRE-family HTH domain
VPKLPKAPRRTDRTGAAAAEHEHKGVAAGDEALEAIGKRVREARLAAGLTGPQLAEKAGCAPNWVYALEAGHQNFTYTTFRRICETLGVDFRQVLIAGDEVRARQTHDRLVALADSAGLRLGALKRLLANDVAQILSELSSINDEGRSLLQLDDAPIGSAGQSRSQT